MRVDPLHIDVLFAARAGDVHGEKDFPTARECFAGRILRDRAGWRQHRPKRECLISGLRRLDRGVLMTSDRIRITGTGCEKRNYSGYNELGSQGGVLRDVFA